MNFGIQGIAKAVSKWKQWPGCANPSCQGNPLKQAIGKKHFGVTLGDRWFCSPECFEPGAQKTIVELLSARETQEKTPALRMPLGLSLVSRGLLDQEQLKTALEHQRETGMNFGEVLQKLGFATPQQVTAAVAAQWGCPVFSLGERPTPAQVRIPRRLMEMYSMMPVHFSDIGQKMMVGFVSRVEHQLLYTIEGITECTATPCFITSIDYRRALHSLDDSSQKDEVVFDRAGNTLEIARTIRSYVTQLGAERVRLGVCRDYLWARVIGRQENDLLFRLETS